MNASFRTAFWAMCLGITVPMVLFVCTRLASGSKAPHATPVAAAEKKTSLRTRLEKPAGNSSGLDSAAGHSTDGAEAESSNPGQKTAANGADSKGNVVLDPLEVDPADPQVVLGPGLEPDPSTSHNRRIPANSVAETRPKIQVKPETVPPATAPSTAALEARLTDIQQGLDKLGRTLDAQAQREPAGDPIKQATELLKQLQEARLINQPPPREEPLAAKPGDDEPQPKRSAGDAASPSTESTSDSVGPKSGVRSLEPKPDLGTRIYRPRYLTGKALQSLIEPLLTPNLGRAGAADLADSETAAASGQNSTAASADALVVHDQQDVLREIDSLYRRLDAPSENVVIEAVVLSVQLNSDRPNGIDLLEFNGGSQPFSMTAIDAGSAAGSSRPTNGRVGVDDPLKLTRKYGLKRGTLNGDPQAFISALLAAAPARRTDAWQMTVVNRQSANLMLTDPFGPGGSSDQSATGAILKIRPLVASRGVVHLDVRQEAGHDFVAASGNRAAALTNQFVLHDGQTAVVGGFFADQSVVQYYRPSGIGGFPLFGNLFVKPVEAIERTETIVLLTPHVASLDGDHQISRTARPVPRTESPAKSPKIVPASGAQERKSPSKLRVIGK